MKTFIVVAVLVGLASPGFAQGSADGAAVTRERVVITREVVVTPRVAPGGSAAIAPTEPATLTGGVGGAIGGYYINGATPAGNLPLPSGSLPLR